MIKSVLGVFVFVLSLTITVQASMCASYLASSIAQPVFSSDLSEKAFWTAFLGHNEYSTAEFKQRGYSTYVASDKFRYDYLSVLTVVSTGPQLADMMIKRNRFDMNLIKSLFEHQKKMVRMYITYVEVTGRKLTEEDKSRLKSFYNYQKKFIQAYNNSRGRGDKKNNVRKFQLELLKIIHIHSYIIETFKTNLPWVL